MKNDNKMTLPLSVLLTFVCSDVRVTAAILLNIIGESNTSMGCFQLIDYKTRHNGTVEQFKIKLSYEDLAGMLMRFAWLMRDINSDNGYAFWLKSTEMQMTEVRKEVVNAYRNEKGETVKVVISDSVVHNPLIGNNNAVIIPNSTFKIKRKHWNG